MQVLEAIHQLTEDVACCGDYEVVVMARAKDPESGAWGTNEIFDVFDLLLDEADEDVNLLTNENRAESADAPRALSVGELLEQLQSLEPRCSTWNLFAGSAVMRMNRELGVRADVPLVGFGVAHEERMYAFLQWPPEQWESGTSET